MEKVMVIRDGFMLTLEPSEASEAFKYRDRLTIMVDILKAIDSSRRGKKKTQIMQSANLNYNQMKKYLGYLADCGLLSVTERETYILTHKGFNFLHFLEFQRIRSLK